MNNRKRKAGVLLHVTSLPSKYGVGTLGKEAYNFIDWMKEANLSIWQVLPLVPTNYGDSPYQSVSSTALNYYLIDLDVLCEEGLLNKKEYQNEIFSYDQSKVDFSILFNKKIEVLKIAFARFDTNSLDFKNFLKAKEYNDFSLYMTIKSLNNFNAWTIWEEKYRTYSEELEKEVINEYQSDYLFWQWTQYEFLREWNKLHNYAKENGIEIMGDMPLYVAYDSVEVWKYPELFMLDENKQMKFVAGCPPDAFTDDGQLWGNPIYDWDYLKETGYEWWNQRIEANFKLVDILRIDHFRGFDRFYAIPYGNENARIGEWLDGPKIDLFKDKLDLNIVAEDLGLIDDGVRKLMKDTGYPGMKILEFAFDGNPENEHKPRNHEENFVVYTGTHDNMPIYQYIKDLSDNEIDVYIKDLIEECEALGVTPKTDTLEELTSTVVELSFASKANICIVPFQDLLAQGKESRMNLPSTVSTDNWSYRVESKNINKKLANRICAYINRYNR